MTDYTLTGSTAEMRAKAVQEHNDRLAKFAQRAFIAKAAQERANLLARNVREFREAEAKAKAVHIEHADHAMQCGDCDNLYKRIARLERKAKKWKRRAKKAEALTYSKANLDAGFAERAKELGYALSDPHDGVNVHADGSMTNARTGKPVGHEFVVPDAEMAQEARDLAEAQEAALDAAWRAFSKPAEMTREEFIAWYKAQSQ